MDLLNSRFIIANADIVKGPGAENEPSIAVEDLMEFRKEFPQIRISIGYTEDGHTEAYTKAMTEAQLENARRLGGKIDFNLREPRIEGSLPVIKDQLKAALDSPEITSVTVTIWNAPSVRDPEVSQEKMNWYLNTLLPKTIPPGKTATIYFDVYRAWTFFEFALYHIKNTPFRDLVHYYFP